VAAVQESALTMELANGSRVISLPGKNDAAVRGYSSVTTLIVDEAARVPDSLYRAMTPTLAVSGGRLIAMSTPFGKRGWFHSEWTGRASWERVKITAGLCPRISADFLAEELEAMGSKFFAQEYDPLSFEDPEGAVFSGEDIKHSLSDDIVPLFA
jgi:hypothetical protein